MLPPQLRHGLSVAQHRTLATRSCTSTLVRAGVAHSNTRSFWGWRRGNDWASHLDPIYHRFCRVRTIKTRAKLLKNLRRRGKFDWDFAQKPFFTPASVRHASHWDGRGKHRGPWYLNVNEGPETEKRGKKDGAVEENGKARSAEEDGYELSQREKIWKEHMERMRKRIEQDPYEAIFGKRFEPFWSPLVPSWMREEMGLQGWPKPTETSKAAANSSETKAKEEKIESAAKAADQSLEKTVDTMKSLVSEASKSEEQKPSTTQPTSYSYASSTSWDSWTNKTRRVEWDSVSKQTKKYEYDPISNRMIRIEAPKSVESKAVEAPASAEQVSSSETPTAFASASKSSETSQSNIKPEAPESKAVNIPVKQSSDVRKAIPIPQPLSQPWLSMFTGVTANGKTETSVGPVKSTAVSSADTTPKTSALAKVPEKTDEVDSLTADDVRAAMGKVKHRVHINTAYPILQKERKARSEQAESIPASSTERDTRLANIFNERDSMGRIGRRAHVQSKGNSEWDQAEMNVMLERELESLQRKKEKLIKDERGLFHIERQKRELSKLDERIKEVTERVEKLSVNPGTATAAAELKADAAQATAKLSSLQSSLERMQSKELPKVVELDDSAAHESTEPLEAFNAVPKNWTQQAELLQADRVRRTASKRAYPYPIPSKSATSASFSRPKDEMEVMTPSILKAQLQKQAAIRQKQKEKAEALEKLEKANAMLEAEVKEQKFRMQAHENRYAHKIRSLRQELETAYKQSAVHSGEHMDRIKWLEKELEKAAKAAGENSTIDTKIGKDIAEGDLHANVAKFGSSEAAAIKRKAMQKAEEKKKDAALIKEVKQIYEDRYGTIDANHRQPTPEPTKKAPKQVVEVESDVDLGEALAKYENEKQEVYQFRRDALENEIAAAERIAHEEQGRLNETGTKLVNDNMPKLIPTELASKPAAQESEPVVKTASDVDVCATGTAIQWEEPPVYKVLAYDSGNDMMSTATTTSNFTGTESPISIPEALSQLYAPARFVPYFAELQRDGYQVIYGTKDLLVFRKVQGAVAAAADVAAKPTLEDHGLAGWEEQLGKPNVEALKTRASNAVNPVDGTSRSSPPVVEPPTGNFASPTGFVNHDPVVPPERTSGPRPNEEGFEEYSRMREEESTGIMKEAHKRFREMREARKRMEEENEDEDMYWRHYPRVRREEYPHFTGMNSSRWRMEELRRSQEHIHNMARGFKKEENRRRRKETFKWFLIAGSGTAAVMYVVGAAAEKAREGQQTRIDDDWAKKAEQARRYREG